jgi:membrane dipeptidase
MAANGTSERAQALCETAFVCDVHAGFEYSEATDLNQLKRWKDAGVDYLSVNAGYDVRTWHRTVTALAAYRQFVAGQPANYVQVRTVDDIRRARAEDKLAIGFDIEGMVALNEDINMVSFYYDLGVRQMLPAYNLNNAAGGGCHDQDVGLTRFGRDVIEEMNRVGMLVDCSHTAYRSTLDAMEVSTKPVVFSHSNSRKLKDHERNILDEQAKEAAATGGLVGVTGVGLFLDDSGVSVAALTNHIDYWADLIGIDRLIIGLDYALAQPELDAIFLEREDFWPKRQYPHGADIGYLEPECFPSIAEALIDRGYSDDQVRGVMGENYLRVVEQVWQ